jgi:hypothetical protein
VDADDRLALPVNALTLDRVEWVRDPGLESGFDPVLDQIQYLAENDLTSLMVLLDFLSKRLAPLQDWWTCTRMDVHQGERHHVAGSRTWV